MPTMAVGGPQGSISQFRFRIFGCNKVQAHACGVFDHSLAVGLSRLVFCTVYAEDPSLTAVFLTQPMLAQGGGVVHQSCHFGHWCTLQPLPSRYGPWGLAKLVPPACVFPFCQPHPASTNTPV